MQVFGLQGIKEHLVAGVILSASFAFMWMVMIYPNTLDWQPAPDQTGTIESLMSNSNIMGPAQINAVVKLQDGRQTIVQVPVQSDVRAGMEIKLDVLENADKPTQKRFRFKSVLIQD